MGLYEGSSMFEDFGELDEGDRPIKEEERPGNQGPTALAKNLGLENKEFLDILERISMRYNTA